MASTFIAWSNPAQALASPISTVASSATAGTSKTILQIRPHASGKIRIIEWGYTLDLSPGNNARIELLETGTAYATVTAHSAVQPFSDSGASSLVQLGTSHTGYNASAEGTVTTTRLFDYQYENGLYYKRQYPLGREPEVGADRALRVRVTPTANSALNIVAYVIWEE